MSVIVVMTKHSWDTKFYPLQSLSSHFYAVFKCGDENGWLEINIVMAIVDTQRIKCSHWRQQTMNKHLSFGLKVLYIFFKGQHDTGKRFLNWKSEKWRLLCCAPKLSRLLTSQDHSYFLKITQIVSLALKCYVSKKDSSNCLGLMIKCVTRKATGYLSLMSLNIN